MEKMKFEDAYSTMNKKIDFLNEFDLLNLQKAGRIGNIPMKKMEKKNQAIKSILKFDVENKFIICKNIYRNPEEYKKEKADEKQILKTREWNMLQLNNVKTEEINIDEIKKAKEEVKKETKKINDIDIQEQNIKTVSLNKNDSLNMKSNLNKKEEELSKQIERIKINFYPEIKNKKIYQTNKINNSYFPLLKEQSEKIKNIIKEYDDKKQNRIKENIDLKMKNKLELQYLQKLYEIKNQNYLFKINNRKINGLNDKNFSYNKEKAKFEIDKLNFIEEYEYIEDPKQNKKILIFKGR